MLVFSTPPDFSPPVNGVLPNQDNSTWYDIDADLSALTLSGAGTIWQFDAGHMDTIVGHPTLKNGHVTLTIPANSALLIKFA